MGAIVFEGKLPYELISQRPPKAVAEDGSVTLTLPVLVPDAPAQSVEIQVILTLQHAADLAAQLQPALELAKAQNRKIDSQVDRSDERDAVSRSGTSTAAENPRSARVQDPPYE